MFLNHIDKVMDMQPDEKIIATGGPELPRYSESPKKPNEIPSPGKDPETDPTREPEPSTWPKREPEIQPEREPLTAPPLAPPEIPKPPDFSHKAFFDLGYQ